MSEQANANAHAHAHGETPARPGETPARPGDDLDALSTHELHDRAMRRAEKHMDVRFLFSLVEMIPAAEALSGKIGEADFDVVSARGAIKDAMRSGEGELAEALRPVFVEYLRKHPDA